MTIKTRRPRIHMITVRPPPDTVIGWLLMVPAILVSLILALFLVGLHFHLGGTGSFATFFPWLGTSLMIAAAPTLLAMRYSHAGGKRRARRRAGKRFERLSRIHAQPDAMSRLPHRVIEHDMIGVRDCGKVLRQLAGSIPAGHVIVRRATVRDQI